MKTWNRFPFVRLIIPLIAGIIAALCYPYATVPLLLAPVVFIIYILLELVFRRKIHYGYRWIYGLLVNFILIVVGYQLTLINTPLFDKDNIVHQENIDQLIVRVVDPVSERPNSYKLLGRVVSIIDSSGIRPASGKVLLYFEKEERVKNIAYGDELLIASKIAAVDPPGNPGEFDYRRYLSNKGIYNRGFVSQDNWKITGEGYGNPVKALGIKLRNKFLKILEENKISGKEYAVVSAILLGYDDHLDPDQRRQFAGAGAMHILCVSGLHVGIIYVILNSLLAFLNRKRWTRFLKVFLLLILIWFYAAVTGFSPSVLRASTMFSFIIAGRTMRRKANIFNMIAASAFFLLVYDPYILTEVGFQLSYLAVTGIVLLYKPIYNLYISDHFLLRKIWQITAVSIAATLFTFPLTVFYFKQFPVLFLITNLVAIPASMLIIYLGLAVLLTSFVPVFSNLVAWLLVWVIKLLNFSVRFIEGLSFSTWRGMHISQFEFMMLVILIISLTVIFYARRKGFLFLLIFSSFGIVISLSIRNYQHAVQNKIAIYNVRKSTAIDFVEGKKGFFLADSSLVKDPSKIDYHISGYRAGLGLKQPTLVSPSDTLIETSTFLKDHEIIQFGGKRLVLLGPGKKYVPGEKPFDVDLVIFTHDPKIRMADLIRIFRAKQVIFDASNQWYNIEKWKSDCDALKINYYDVSERGAWLAEL